MRTAGFSLVELLVAMVIMAIITGIATAGYRQHVRRTHRTDATIALLQIATAQERYYLRHNRYATTGEELGDPPPDGLGLGETAHGHYRLALAAHADGAAIGYTATATAREGGRQADDLSCRQFTLTQDGQRGAVAADGSTGAEIRDRCWR